MLKIIDNVDLKELEKFGFEKVFVDNRIDYVKRNNYDYIEIAVEEEKYIFIGIVSGLNILFDLIQAGLVEKVED